MKKTNFSIIIPTHDRINSVLRLVKNLVEQNYAGKYEVIVVSNSADSTEQNALKLLTRQHKQVRVLREKKLGPTFARNLGCKAAQYSIWCFLDDDMVVSPTYLSELAASWKLHPTARLIGGKSILPKELMQNVSIRLVKKYPWLFAAMDRGNKDIPLQLGETLYSCHLSYRHVDGEKKAIFNSQFGNYQQEQIGGEDYELCQRFLLQGAEVWYSSKLLAYHYSSKIYNLSYFLSRQWQGGREIALLEQVLIGQFPKFKTYTLRTKLRDDFIYRLKRGELGVFLRANVFDPLFFIFFTHYFLTWWFK